MNINTPLPEDFKLGAQSTTGAVTRAFELGVLRP